MVIKVLSYNIHKGRSFFLRRRIWDDLEALVNEVNPDIIFLQEFLIEPQAEKLLEKFADKLWPHYSFGQNATTGDYRYGNAILSKFPFIETHSTDISTNPLEKRGLLYGKVQVKEDFELSLFCTHLDLTHRGRKLQIEKINKATKKLLKKHQPIILAGDFNDWDNKIHIDIENYKFKESSTSTLGSLIPTSPSIYPKFSLDRIYYKNLEIVSSEVLSATKLKMLSDHLPVVSKFKIP